MKIVAKICSRLIYAVIAVVWLFLAVDIIYKLMY